MGGAITKGHKPSPLAEAGRAAFARKGQEHLRASGLQHFSRWTLYDVDAAYQRAREAKANKVNWESEEQLGIESMLEQYDAAIMLSRREFADVFSDYTRVGEGDPLVLPLEMFDVFAQMPSKSASDAEARLVEEVENKYKVQLRRNPGLHARRGTKTWDEDEANRQAKRALQRVDAIEVLTAMALMCDSQQSIGGIEAVLRWLFHLHDHDDNKEMDFEEISTLLRILASVAVKLGLLASVPGKPALQLLSREMFKLADKDDDARISDDEFISWAKSNIVSEKLLRHMRRIRDSQLAELKAQAVQEAREIADATTIARISKSRKVASRKPQTPIAVRKARREIKRRRANNGGIVGMGVAHRVKQLRRRAGALMRIASREALHELSRYSKFSIKELEALRSFFLDASDYDVTRSGVKKAKVERHKFPGLMRAVFPDINEDAVGLNRLFDLFDVNKDGKVEYSEFVLGLAQWTSGSVTEKINLMFNTFDLDGGGSLTIQEIADFVQAEGETLVAESDFLVEVVADLDADGSGEIDREEFIAALSATPFLFECFSTSMVPGMEKLAPELKRWQAKKSTKWDLQLLRTLWLKYSAGSAECGRTVTLTQFRRFMQDNLGATSDVMPLVNKVYDVFDTDGSGEVDWKELFNGLATVCAGTIEEKASFYFNLYDVDGSGEIDTDEVMEMLMSSREAADTSKEVVSSFLQALDEDGDGSITRSEFIAAVSETPELMECFGRLFHCHDDDSGYVDPREKAKAKLVNNIRDMIVAAVGPEAEQVQPATQGRRRSSGAALRPGTRGSLASRPGSRGSEASHHSSQSRSRASRASRRGAVTESTATEARQFRSPVDVAVMKLRRMDISTLSAAVSQLQKGMSKDIARRVLAGDMSYIQRPDSVAAREAGRRLSQAHLPEMMRELRRASLVGAKGAEDVRKAPVLRKARDGTYEAVASSVVDRSTSSKDARLKKMQAKKRAAQSTELSIDTTAPVSGVNLTSGWGSPRQESDTTPTAFENRLRSGPYRDWGATLGILSVVKKMRAALPTSAATELLDSTLGIRDDRDETGFAGDPLSTQRSGGSGGSGRDGRGRAGDRAAGDGELATTTPTRHRSPPRTRTMAPASVERLRRMKSRAVSQDPKRLSAKKYRAPDEKARNAAADALRRVREARRREMGELRRLHPNRSSRDWTMLQIPGLPRGPPKPIVEGGVPGQQYLPRKLRAEEPSAGADVLLLDEKPESPLSQPVRRGSADKSAIPGKVSPHHMADADGFASTGDDAAALALAMRISPSTLAAKPTKQRAQVKSVHRGAHSPPVDEGNNGAPGYSGRLSPRMREVGVTAARWIREDSGKRRASGASSKVSKVSSAPQLPPLLAGDEHRNRRRIVRGRASPEEPAAPALFSEQLNVASPSLPSDGDDLRVDMAGDSVLRYAKRRVSSFVASKAVRSAVRISRSTDRPDSRSSRLATGRRSVNAPRPGSRGSTASRASHGSARRSANTLGGQPGVDYADGAGERRRSRNRARSGDSFDFVFGRDRALEAATDFINRTPGNWIQSRTEDGGVLLIAAENAVQSGPASVRSGYRIGSPAPGSASASSAASVGSDNNAAQKELGTDFSTFRNPFETADIDHSEGGTLSPVLTRRRRIRHQRDMEARRAMGIEKKRSPPMLAVPSLKDPSDNDKYDWISTDTALVGGVWPRVAAHAPVSTLLGPSREDLPPQHEWYYGPRDASQASSPLKKRTGTVDVPGLDAPRSMVESAATVLPPHGSLLNDDSGVEPVGTNASHQEALARSAPANGSLNFGPKGLERSSDLSRVRVSSLTGHSLSLGDVRAAPLQIHDIWARATGPSIDLAAAELSDVLDEREVKEGDDDEPEDVLAARGRTPRTQHVFPSAQHTNHLLSIVAVANNLPPPGTGAPEDATPPKLRLSDSDSDPSDAELSVFEVF